MVVVIDASAVIECLVGGPDADGIERQLLAASTLAAPAHLPLEVASALRGLERSGKLRQTLDELMTTFGALRLDLLDIDPLLDRALDLRANATVYDALYLAAAESVFAPLLTCDRKLADTPRIRCKVLLPT